MTAKKKRKPTQKDWEKMQALFLKGEKPRFIVEKFAELDVTAKQISTKFSKKNLGIKKKKIEEKTQEKLIEKIIDIKTKTNEANLKAFTYLQQKVLEKIRQDTYQVVVGKEAEIVNIENDLGQLAKASVALEKIQKGQRLALDMDKEENNIVEEPEIVYVENLDINKI